MLHVFGIRHHGPGSAKSLLQALHQLQPDCILIEAPADAESMLSLASDVYLKPPVALLIYNPKNFHQATFLPFASFSPEWVAIQFATQHQVPVRFMDLPMTLQFGYSFEVPPLVQAASDEATDIVNIAKDPLGYVAALAGYEDSERWWEVTFEQQASGQQFEAVLELMTELRAVLTQFETQETLLREAYMRKTAHQALKEGFKKIAIVCGAWHSPIFNQFDRYQPKKDNAALKTSNKVKTESTWIPWTYERLATSSGYRAGVVSPAWYEILFHHTEEETTRWIVQAARLLRQEDLDASAAHAIETIRLANTLASMRNLGLPGIEELKEAAITVLCNGNQAAFELIEQKLIVGTAVGKVAQSVKMVPLQKDLEEQIKTTKLKKYWENPESQWLKASASSPRGGIDLREANDLMKSRLLHRLNILNIPWGISQAEGKYDKGSFKEYWKLKWQPEFVIQLIEASRWGNTVVEAATKCILERANENDQVIEIVLLLEQAMLADLNDAFTVIIDKLQVAAARAQDVFRLMQVFTTSVRMLRYGAVRTWNAASLQTLIDQLMVRITIALPAACSRIDDDFAAAVVTSIRNLNDAIQTLQQTEHQTTWYAALQQVEITPQVHPQVQGYVTRLLFDKQILLSLAVEKRMQFTFSKGNSPLHATYWLEGFLQGSGLVLIYHQELWQILDEWMRHLEEDNFLEIVPMLRRAFSAFSAAEREKLLTLAKGATLKTTSSPNLNQDFEAITETVGVLLGW